MMSDGTEPNQPGDCFVNVPMRARDEIGELAYYLEQVRRNLLQVNDHVAGSSRTMPTVLHDLGDIVKMTEKATVRVLEETEALLEESGTVLGLIGGVSGAAREHAAGQMGSALDTIRALAQKSNDRAMSIMAALEFQDLTAQKIQRAFEVLEEVSGRLQKIHELVTPGHRGQEAPAPAPILAAEPPEAERKSGQDLADELLMQFKG